MVISFHSGGWRCFKAPLSPHHHPPPPPPPPPVHLALFAAWPARPDLFRSPVITPVSISNLLRTGSGSLSGSGSGFDPRHPRSITSLLHPSTCAPLTHLSIKANNQANAPRRTQKSCPGLLRCSSQLFQLFCLLVDVFYCFFLGGGQGEEFQGGLLPTRKAPPRINVCALKSI